MAARATKVGSGPDLQAGPAASLKVKFSRLAPWAGRVSRHGPRPILPDRPPAILHSSPPLPRQRFPLLLYCPSIIPVPFPPLPPIPAARPASVSDQTFHLLTLRSRGPFHAPMTPRILVPDGWQPALPDGHITLGTTELHHLAVVLRRGAGDPIELFDGEGRSIPAVLESLVAETAQDRPRGRSRGRDRANALVARLAGPESFEAAPALSIRLAQGISSHERMDWTIEKAVEAGVDRIVALQASRSASRGAPRQLDARRQNHWERIIASACAQCGRNRLARLDAVAPARDWLDGGAGDDGRTHRFLLAPQAAVSLAEALGAAPAPDTVWVACGPEAGFDAAETQSFVKAGWRPVGLGPRTLRTETAALMAVAIIQSRWGDLR